MLGYGVSIGDSISEIEEEQRKKKPLPPISEMADLLLAADGHAVPSAPGNPGSGTSSPLPPISEAADMLLAGTAPAPAPVPAIDRSEHGNNMALNLNVPEAAKDPLHIGAAVQNAYWNLQESKGNTEAMRAFQLEQSKKQNAPGGVVAVNRSGVAPMTPVEEAVMLRQMAAKDRGDMEQAAGLEKSFDYRVDELKENAKRLWEAAEKGRVKYDLPDNKFGAAILQTIESSGMTVEAALRSGALWALGGPALGLMGSFVNTATEADYEAGETFVKALKAGKSPEEIQDAVNSVRVKNLALLSLTNPLGDVLLFGLGKPLKALAGKIAGKGLLAKAGRAVTERGIPYLLGAAPEGVEGGSQEAFQQQAAGQDLDWEKIKEAAGSEALASLLYGAVGRGIRGGAKVLLGSQADSDGGRAGEPPAPPPGYGETSQTEGKPLSPQERVRSKLLELREKIFSSYLGPDPRYKGAAPALNWDNMSAAMKKQVVRLRKAMELWDEGKYDESERLASLLKDEMMPEKDTPLWAPVEETAETAEPSMPISEAADQVLAAPPDTETESAAEEKKAAGTIKIGNREIPIYTTDDSDENGPTGGAGSGGIVLPGERRGRNTSMPGTDTSRTVSDTSGTVTDTSTPRERVKTTIRGQLEAIAAQGGEQAQVLGSEEIDAYSTLFAAMAEQAGKRQGISAEEWLQSQNLKIVNGRPQFEASSEGTKLNQTVNYGVDLSSVAKGTVITPKFINVDAGSFLKREGRKQLEDSVIGEYKNEDTQWDIVLSRRNVSHAISSALSNKDVPLNVSMEVIAELPRILERMRLVESHDDRHQGRHVRKVHRFYSAVQISTEPDSLYKVKLTVKEINEKLEVDIEGIYRAYDAKIIAKAPADPRQGELQELSTDHTTGAFDVILESLLDGVKDSDGNFYLSNNGETRSQSMAAVDSEYLAAVEAGDMESAQKLVDQTAREAGYDIGPVYHGTNSEFNTFDRDKVGKNYGKKTPDHIGFFFTNRKDGDHPGGTAKDWARQSVEKKGGTPVVVGTYLKINNPFTLSDYAASIGDDIETIMTYAGDRQPVVDIFDNDSQYILNKAMEMGKDGIIFVDAFEGDSDGLYVAFEPEQIKSADPIVKDDQGNVIPLSERFNSKKSDIRYQASTADTLDAEYLAAVEAGDLEAARQLVDEAAKEAGFTVQHVFHGSKRIDRLGNELKPERATSGPMPFFTDDPTIAENYSQNKADTSIEIPESYTGWFKVTVGRGKPKTIDQAWLYLSLDKRRELAAKLPHVVNTDQDGGNDGEFVLSPDGYGMTDKTHWDHVIREKRGNVLEAAVEIWLKSGELFDQEEKFLEILRVAGLDGVVYDSPWLERPGVVEAHLAIRTPFDTSDISDDDFAVLKAASKGKRGSTNIADEWDKRRFSGKEWIALLEKDRKDGTSFAWTSIPDWVSRELQRMGYDGIKDQGGKYTGEGHTVWIPFFPWQVKRADAITRDNQGTVIPLSQRFDTAAKDIRFQDAAGSDSAPTTSARGSILFSEKGTRIRLNESMDRSTLLHEFGHLFLRDLEVNTRGGEASSARDFGVLKEWWKKEASWLASWIRNSTSATVPDGVRVRFAGAKGADLVRSALDGAADQEAIMAAGIAAEEMFARGFERYLSEGSAPSSALKQVFERFKVWLSEVYEKMAGNPNFRLSKEARDAMARMVGGERLEDEARNAVSVRKNLGIGLRAMKTVIERHEDVPDAMSREDLGSVSFVWGTPGKGKGFKGGYGVSHIIARRNSEGNDGEKVARKMVEVIAKGRVARRYGPEGAERADIAYDGHTAVLSLYSFDEKKTWLLSGWKDYGDVKSSGAREEGFDSSGATHQGPTHTRPMMGAEDYENIIASLEPEDNISESGEVRISSPEKEYFQSSNKKTKQQQALTHKAEETEQARRMTNAPETPWPGEGENVTEADIDEMFSEGSWSPEGFSSAVQAIDDFFTPEKKHRGGEKGPNDPKNRERYDKEGNLLSENTKEVSYLNPIYTLTSPSLLAKKNKLFAPFFKMAKEAQELQETLRRDFNAVLDKAWGSLSEDQSQALNEILIEGDLRGRTFTDLALTARGLDEDVRRGYSLIRDLSDRVGKAVRQRQRDSGTKVMGWREGYVPHIFHGFFIRLEGRIVDTARSLQEAVELARNVEKDHPGGTVDIASKPNDFSGSSAYNASALNDRKLLKFSTTMEEAFAFTPDEAERFLKGYDKKAFKNRIFAFSHERLGVKGWDQDMKFAFRHYVNQSARFLAMDELKYKGIGLFEKTWGNFNHEYSQLADYTKKYLNDELGVPSNASRMMNELFKRIPGMYKISKQVFGDRPAEYLASVFTKGMGVAKLGFFNISSAMMNYSQLVNASSVLGYRDLGLGLREYFSNLRNPSERVMRIYEETGVLDNLNVSAGAGYSKASEKLYGTVGRFLELSMAPFAYMDGMCRKATVLAAYNKAHREGKGHKDAIAYAKEINDRANFDYSIADTPAFIRRSGPLGQVAFQFKKFGIKQLEFAIGLNGFAENARFWIPMIALSGLWGFPGAELLKALFMAMFDRDPQAELNAWMAKEDWIPEPVRRTIQYGALSNAGVDISKRVGMGDVIPNEVADLLGPTVGTIHRMAPHVATLAGKLFGLEGDGTAALLNALEALSPGLSNPIKAILGEVEDKKRGRLKFRYQGSGERAVRAMGFRPTREAVESDAVRAANYLEAKRLDREREAIDEYVRARDSGSTKDAAKALARLKELKVTPDRIIRELRERKKGTAYERLQQKLKGQKSQEARKVLQGF